MSENLHPNYLMTLETITPLISGENKEWGLVYYINFYPSGLVLRIESPTWQGASQGYFSATNKLVGPTQIQNIQWLSPVPKTYEFLDENNNIKWKINKSDWNQPTNTNPFYSCSCSTSRNGFNVYYIGGPSGAVATSCNKILFIDHNLWNYRDNKTVNGNQTKYDIELYPIYKNSNNEYLLNNQILIGTYNFLTSYSALYQYNKENKLKECFLTGQISPNINYNNIEEIYSSKIQEKYRSIKDNHKLIYDNGFNQEDNHYQSNNQFLIQKNNYSIETPKVLFENWTNAQNYNETPSFTLDEYHSYINNVIYRHSNNFVFIKATRKCDKNFSDALISTWEDFLGPLGYYALQTGEEYKSYYHDVWAQAGQSSVTFLGGRSTTPGAHMNPIFQYQENDFTLEYYKLTSLGWQKTSDFTPNISFYEEEHSSIITGGIRYHRNHAMSYTEVVYGNWNTDNKLVLPMNHYVSIKIKYPVLSFLNNSTNCLNGYNLEIQPNNISNKWWYENAPYSQGTKTKISFWAYNNINNSSKIGVNTIFYFDTAVAGIIKQDETFSLLRNGGYNNDYQHSWHQSLEDHPTYDGYSFEGGIHSQGNYVGINFDAIIHNSAQTTATCIFGCSIIPIKPF